MAEFFNTGLTQQEFLDQYWQKRPLLIRQAFPDFESPISPDELTGLAYESEIESRLIVEQGREQLDPDTRALPDSICSGEPYNRWCC
mgnify:CR=1 FL=1